MAKKNKDISLSQIEYDKGMVLYSDGGTRGAGYSGWGVHGYLYSNEPTNKGSGNLTQFLTDSGYVPKIDNKGTKEVKPITYIDAFGTLPTPSTNNAAEVVGANNSFCIADNHPIKKLTLYTDSQYVVNGANDWLTKWKKNDFIKQDGSSVSNKLDWLDLDKSLNILKNKGVEVSVQWIKGHNNNLGNDLADRGATMGVMYARAGINRSEIDSTPAAGYWSQKIEHHPFLSKKAYYFNTKVGSNTTGQYYLGDIDKDDQFLTFKTTDGSLCYIELDTPDDVMELIRTKQTIEAKGLEVITSVRLDKLFNHVMTKDIIKHSDVCLFRPNPMRIDLSHVDKQPVSRGLLPPRLAGYAMDALSELKGMLLAFKDTNKKELIGTDITDIIYSLTDKKELSLSDNIDSACNKLTANVCYGALGINKEYKLDLYLDVDLPGRNTLKRLEKLNPQITIVTVMESLQSFRYVTIIKVQNAIGIWSSICSNLKIVDKIN